MIHVEQVVRVIAGLDLSQAVPGRTRVGVAHQLFAFVVQEIGVDAGIPLVQSCGKVIHPGLAYSPILGAGVEGGQVGHDP